MGSVTLRCLSLWECHAALPVSVGIVTLRCLCQYGVSRHVASVNAECSVALPQSMRSVTLRCLTQWRASLCLDSVNIVCCVTLRCLCCQGILCTFANSYETILLRRGVERCNNFAKPGQFGENHKKSSKVACVIVPNRFEFWKKPKGKFFSCIYNVEVRSYILSYKTNNPVLWSDCWPAPSLTARRRAPETVTIATRISPHTCRKEGEGRMKKEYSLNIALVPNR
jgi:hypothetical protein